MSAIFAIEQITNINKEIANILHQLYNLTDQEIKVIEES